jgi:dynein heavy chain
MRQACADERPDQKWIVFDAPVDTLWIESMNSVMDDNKILTLINGERISMPEQVSLLIETQDLAVASPATVSRCGMVFLDTVDLGWRPYVESWLQKHDNRELAEHLQRLFDKFVDKLLVFRQKSCKELVPTAQLNSVISLCTLFNALATPENGVNPEDPEHYLRMVELWFLFSMIWSICASVDEQSRKKMDNYIRELEGQFPSKDTVYEYYVDVKQKGWTLWEEKLRSGWRYNSALPFYKIMVPTVDTVRYDFIVHSLISARRPVLLVGPVGTGKTSVAQSVLSKLDPRMYSVLTINMSAQTSSNNVQEIIESKVEKRTKGVFVPSGGKKMITFLDDLNMPTKDTFGSQPPLELLRMWLDYGFWYDRQKQTKKEIRDMFLLAAMGPPGGGRQVISRRLQGRFNLLNMTFPHESQIKRIFGTMINQKLQDFEEDVKPIGDIMTQATVEIYEMISTRMLPTPTKIHYLFNLRDISKVFQGLLRAHKDYHDTKAAMTRLWVHECFRVFSDRLVDSRDAEMFKDMLNEKLGTLFDVSFYNLCPNKQSPIFGDFLRVDNAVYEDIMDFKQLKSFMEASLEDYNNTAGVIAMDLVLFKDAIEHVCRVVRVIRQPRGNMLLVGIGGSGRQSLTRLAAYILEYEVFQIEISRHYRQTEFREDLRKLYATAGVDNKPTVFLFTDTQVVEETFLEDINNILSSGEVPNLYKPEEFEEVRSALADVAKKDGIVDVPDVMFAYFIERVRNNLHVVLCMSPVGEPFRNRIRQYPAFVNCTTIDWFSEWPKDALLEVSERYLEEVNLGTGDAALEV